MANERVRIYVRGVPQMQRLNFSQKQMMKLGTVAVASVTNRARAGRNANDAPAKPLTKRYAIWKTKALSRGGFRKTGKGGGRKNVRDLNLTGNMLRNFRIRTVTNNQANAACSTRKDRIKAKVNNQREIWIALSRKNILEVVRAGRQILSKELRPRLWRTRR